MLAVVLSVVMQVAPNRLALVCDSAQAPSIPGIPSKHVGWQRGLEMIGCSGYPAASGHIHGNESLARGKHEGVHVEGRLTQND